MSGVIKYREKQIEELDRFIDNTRKRIEDVVSGLGWTYESISNESQTIVTCPFNDDHRIEEKSLEHHLEKCQWKAEGYGEEDTPLSEPCPSVDATSSIKFDEQLQDEVLLRAKEKDPTMRTAIGVADRLIPRTSDRLMASFTGDERKAMYDYVVENTIKPDIGDDIADMNKISQKDGNNPKISLLELLAQERNLKRRRAKHRGVHTNKKSQVEILREVINQQMEMYEEYIADTKVKREPKSPSSLDGSSSKCRERGSNSHNFLPTKREYGHERDRKRNRSGSRETERRKHRSKHDRDRNRHEEERGRRRSREDKRHSIISEDKKRHKSRDNRDKRRDRSRRRDKSNDHHSRRRRN